MPQLTYSLNPGGALPGMIFGSGVMDVISKTNSTNQLNNVLVVNAVNSAVHDLDFVFTLTDGSTVSETATFTADGSATKTEIRDGLIAAINDDAVIGLYVVAVAVDSDEFTVERLSSNEGVSFTLASSGDTPTDLTITTLVADSQEIPFGVFVVVDAQRGDDFCRLPRVSGDIGGKTLGVAKMDTARQPNAGGYATQSTVAILEKGKIYVTCEEAFTFGADVYVRYASSGNGTQLGAVRTDADSSTAAQLTRAKFISSGAADTIALIELS